MTQEEVPVVEPTSIALLDGPDSLKGAARLIALKEWRSRVIEELRIDRASYLRSEKSLQAAPLREFIGDLIPAEDSGKSEVFIVIPTFTLPKGPVVNLDVVAPGGQAFLLKRKTIAEIQAAYVKLLADQLAIDMTDAVLDFVVAICEFTPGPWDRFAIGKNSSDEQLCDYLSEGLALDIDRNLFANWKELAERISTPIGIAFDEGFDVRSSADNPLLAMPLLAEKYGDRLPAAGTDLLGALGEFVEKCVELDGSHSPVLEALGDYGRRYEALVQCAVPLDMPFTIKMNRDVDLQVGRIGHASVDVQFNDALSNHVAVSVSDPDVQLRHREPEDGLGRRVDGRHFTLVRSSTEDIAIYGSDVDRPYALRLKFRLVPSASVLLASAVFLFTAATSVMLLTLVRPLASDDVALLVLPSTFVSTLIVLQQRTTIAGRLQAPVRVILAVIMLTLWCIVIWYLLDGTIRTGP